MLDTLDTATYQALKKVTDDAKRLTDKLAFEAGIMGEVFCNYANKLHILSPEEAFVFKKYFGFPYSSLEGATRKTILKALKERTAEETEDYLPLGETFGWGCWRLLSMARKLIHNK